MTSFLLENLPVRSEYNFIKVCTKDAPPGRKILQQAQQYIPLHNTDPPHKGVINTEDENILLRHFYQFQPKSNPYFDEEDQHMLSEEVPDSPVVADSFASPTVQRSASDELSSPPGTGAAAAATGKRTREAETTATITPETSSSQRTKLRKAFTE
eukprot:gb/GECG01009183.1/.p1 GENE.gb/GECG01009183.1/~~gb/GECG01009183.1/.p1  ORF type:complete len:155 (+),score=25.54 gb/GECG01009183.1/:1-465(+)